MIMICLARLATEIRLPVQRRHAGGESGAATPPSLPIRSAATRTPQFLESVTDLHAPVRRVK